MSRPDYIFAKPDLDAVIENQRGKLREEVTQISGEGLQQGVLSETEARLLEKYSISPLEIMWEQEDVVKEEVKAMRQSDLGRGRTFQRQEVVLRIKVPFTGDPLLFSFSPTAFPMNAPRAHVQGQHLEFVYQAAQHDLVKLRQEYDEDVRMTKACVTKIAELLAAYHDTLPQLVRQLLEARRDQLRVVDNALAELGFNIRRHPDPNPAVSFPLIRKQIVRPLQPEPKRGPDPLPHRVLETADYDEILSFLAGMSVAIERNPSTFADIGEEPLRDWFLVALNGAFRGDATGETFNREGKTDISIRVDGQVIFIAECKFWSGEKGLLETADQLLRYLTWRDSKASIMLFSRNADFSAVLAQIPRVLQKHPHFVRSLSYGSETGFRFLLRNRTDAAREHVVTLLVFHIPRNAT